MIDDERIRITFEKIVKQPVADDDTIDVFSKSFSGSPVQFSLHLNLATHSSQ